MHLSIAAQEAPAEVWLVGWSDMNPLLVQLRAVRARMQSTFFGDEEVIGIAIVWGRFLLQCWDRAKRVMVR